MGLENNTNLSPSENDYSHQQANKLLQLQREIMEFVAMDYDHQLIFDKLCLMTEQLVPDALASIMIYDEAQSNLQVLSAPSLPELAVKALNGLVPDPQAGSCANAVYHNQPQFISNTLTCPHLC